MRGGLTSRMVVASGLLAVVVAAAFAFLVRAIQAEHNSANRSKLSQQILSSTNELERLVVDLETGQRGFVITGQARFLDPWTAAQSEIPKVSRELNRRTTVTAQGQRARQITAAVASYVADYSVPLVEAARRGEASAGSVDAIDEGKRRVDALRAGFDRLVTTERNFALASQNHSDASARRAIVAASFGLVGSVVLIVLFALYLTGQIVRPVRRAAAMASQFASGDLSVRMPETGPAEIGALEHSFNTMGDSLEASREDLAASRARVVAAADETRRRIERDLHDGTQQRLVSLALELRTAETFVPPGLEHLATQLAHTARGLAAVVEDLQEVSRGIHPAILSKGGLGPALRNLARRSAVPVELDVPADGRLPDAVEVAVYFVVSEALTNVAKHAQATVVTVDLKAEDAAVRLSIRDDGVGGADPGHGSGLVGLRDRVEALGGKMDVLSTTGRGTSLLVRMPIDGQSPAPSS